MSLRNNSEFTISNENNTMPNLPNNTLLNKEDSFFNKNRKDPKIMTMDELDELLKKNNINEPSNLIKKLGNKDSFNYSQNYSQFNESSKINSNTNANSNNSNIKDLKKENKKSVESKSELESSPTKSATNRLFYFDESQNFSKNNAVISSGNSNNYSQKYNYSSNQNFQENQNPQPIARNNFFSEENFVIMKSPERNNNEIDMMASMRSQEKLPQFNETSENNFKVTQKSFTSPTRDNMFNFSGFSDNHYEHLENENKLNITNENWISSPQAQTSFQSNAAKNVIKALQDKNKNLLIENEDLKKTILEQNKFYSQSMEVEKILKEEIENLTQENKNLVQRLNKSQVEITMLNSNLSMLEKEKIRHLDFSAEEKEELKKKIYDLKMENYKILSENKKVSESFNQVRNFLKQYKQEIENLNKELNLMKKENSSLKKKFQLKISTYTKELGDLKSKFDLEKSDLQDKINKLNEFVQNLQTQKKEIINDCEAKVNKIKAELMTINDSKVKLFLKSINPVELKGGSRFVKLKSNEKPPNTSRSKSKETKKPLSTNRRNPETGYVNKLLSNNTYYKKVAPTQNTKHNYTSAFNQSQNNTNPNNYNAKYTRNSNKSKDHSGLDLKENMENLTVTANNMDFLESGSNTIETLSQKMRTNVGSGVNSQKQSMHRKSNSCLDLLNNNVQIENNQFIPEEKGSYLNYNSGQKNENNDNNKLSEVNDMIFNLERNIAELNRNFQSLSLSLKNTNNQNDYNTINRKIGIITNNLQIQTEKLNDLKNCQRELLLKGAINF